jgi:putative transposase
MRNSRYSEEQIIALLKEHDAGVKTTDLCRKHGISTATFYNWKAKFGGMDVSDAKRLRHLEEENAKLKRVVADLTLDNVVLKDLVAKNVWSGA